jgi:hypothetical protein
MCHQALLGKGDGSERIAPALNWYRCCNPTPPSESRHLCAFRTARSVYDCTEGTELARQGRSGRHVADLKIWEKNRAEARKQPRKRLCRVGSSSPLTREVPSSSDNSNHSYLDRERPTAMLGTAQIALFNVTVNFFSLSNWPYPLYL